MSKSDYVAHLETQMAGVDHRIESAKKMLESGDVEGKSQALEDLAHLRSRHEELVQRIEAAKAKGADHWSSIHASFKEEADALSDTLEKWLTKL